MQGRASPPTDLQMHRYETIFQAMGTRCSAQLYAASQDRADVASRQVVAEVARLEAKYSRYRPDSLLSAINRVARAGGSIDVDAETALLLDYATTCYHQSDGLFDISSGILRKAWDFKAGKVPDAAALAALLALTGWDKLAWQAPTLSFPLAGMELDFGGVVKEYAADRAAALCLEHDIHNGLINLGGDIRVVGPHADGSPWQLGISDPANPANALCTLSLSSGALASSGDYERGLTLNGVRYGHILNPRTGWPVAHLAAVSVVADLCVVAGSASTIAMLMDTQGAGWLHDLGLQHLWVDVQGRSGGSLQQLQAHNA